LRVDEEGAWQTVVQLYTPLVFHWCARGGVAQADADDVLQEVFLAASKSFTQFRRDRPGDSFRGWLRGIAKNMMLLHFRRSGRQQPVPATGGTDAFRKLQEIAQGTTDTDDDDARPELDTLHRRALELVKAEFEERTWQMFWLTAIEGKSPVDIATVMGVGPAAVRMAKSRVLHRLREEFGDLVD
jgi:RNA polymerase sigma-70 factor, ECF subfamily